MIRLMNTDQLKFKLDISTGLLSRNAYGSATLQEIHHSYTEVQLISRMMFEKSVDCTQQSGSDKSHKRVNELIRFEKEK